MPRRDSSLGTKALIAALCFIVRCGAAAAQGALPPPAVSVTPVVTRQVTETGEFIGRVTAINKVDIVARVPGFIEERNFTEGQQVKKGDLLFRIEQATYKAAVEQRRANLAKAKATEVNAKLQLERGKELVRNQNIPQATLDQRAADEAAAQANVMEAQAMLAQAEIDLGYTEIRSPINGQIELATFTEGNLVQPSSGKLATIVSQDPIYVIFQASERDVLEYKRRIAQSQEKSPHVTIHIKLPNGSAPYQDDRPTSCTVSTLPPDITARIVVEQASTFGWGALRRQVRPNYQDGDIRRVGATQGAATKIRVRAGPRDRGRERAARQERKSMRRAHFAQSRYSAERPSSK